MSFTDTYAYRGTNPRVYYLSPWEFTKWWHRIPLRPPNSYTNRGERPLTQWTKTGEAYNLQLAAKDHHLPAPKPGTHYVVLEPSNATTYITFPDVTETTNVRHRWVLMRNTRPRVPQPTKTLMLKQKHAHRRTLRHFKHLPSPVDTTPRRRHTERTTPHRP